MIEIKRGASFRVAFKFETDDEWNTVFPADYIASQARFGDEVFNLECDVDQLAKTIYIRGETDEWPVGEGEFDVIVVAGDLKLPLPEITNIPITVIQGVTG